MISSIICIIKAASISWSEFTHIVFPITLFEFFVEEALINILLDKLLDRKSE